MTTLLVIKPQTISDCKRAIAVPALCSARTCSLEKSHSLTGLLLRARESASAVPQEPAPRTATGVVEPTRRPRARRSDGVTPLGQRPERHDESLPTGLKCIYTKAGSWQEVFLSCTDPAAARQWLDNEGLV